MNRRETAPPGAGLNRQPVRGRVNRGKRGRCPTFEPDSMKGISMWLKYTRLAAGLVLSVMAVAGCASAAHSSAVHHKPGTPAPAVTPQAAAPLATPAAAHPARHHRRRHDHPAAPPAAITPPPPPMNPIPQGNGGDQDADNNGGPTDGDGNI
jgi:hypothetical protein